MNLLTRAITLALENHDDQVDKAGKPYILHLLRVMLALAEMGERYMIPAVLHDVIEDSDVTLSEIERQFGPETAFVVGSLTHTKGEWYPDYIERVKQSPIAVTIKMADLRDNLQRLHGLPREVADRLEAKYTQALNQLVLGSVPRPTVRT